MKNTILVTLAIAAFTIATTVNAEDSAANGKAKSAACVSCHGLNGKSNNPQNPHLAGQQKLYLIKALTDYRDKKRTDAMMNMVTGSLTDQDIKDLATFYSSNK